MVYKMTSHDAGTVQMREESESGTRKWEEMWFKLCCCRATFLEQPPSTLARRDISYNSFRRELNNVLVLMLLPGRNATSRLIALLLLN